MLGFLIGQRPVRYLSLEHYRNVLDEIDSCKMRIESMVIDCERHVHSSAKHRLEELRQNAEFIQQQTHLQEAIRALAELLVYGEQHSMQQYFELFAVKSILPKLVDIIRCSYTTSLVKRQVLQSLSICIMNLEQEQSLFYMLSRNYINQLIRNPQYLEDDEELIAAYISLMKTLSLRLNKRTFLFFLNSNCPDFPLYNEAVKLIGHSEPMVQAAVKAITLNVFKLAIAEQPVLDAILLTARTYFGSLMRMVFDRLVAFSISASATSECIETRKLHDLRNAIEDSFLYIEDILQFHNQSINEVLLQSLAEDFILLLLQHFLMQKDSNTSRCTFYALSILLRIIDNCFCKKLVSKLLLSSDLLLGLKEFDLRLPNELLTGNPFRDLYFTCMVNGSDAEVACGAGLLARIAVVKHQHYLLNAPYSTADTRHISLVPLIEILTSESTSSFQQVDHLMITSKEQNSAACNIDIGLETESVQNDLAIAANNVTVRSALIDAIFLSLMKQPARRLASQILLANAALVLLAADQNFELSSKQMDLFYQYESRAVYEAQQCITNPSVAWCMLDLLAEEYGSFRTSWSSLTSEDNSLLDEPLNLLPDTFSSITPTLMFSRPVNQIEQMRRTLQMLLVACELHLHLHRGDDVAKATLSVFFDQLHIDSSTVERGTSIELTENIEAAECALLSENKQLPLWLVLDLESCWLVSSKNAQFHSAVVECCVNLRTVFPEVNLSNNAAVLHLTIQSSRQPHPDACKIKGHSSSLMPLFSTVSSSFTQNSKNCDSCFWLIVLRFTTPSECIAIQHVIEQARSRLRRKLLNSLIKTLQTLANEPLFSNADEDSMQVLLIGTAPDKKC